MASAFSFFRNLQKDFICMDHRCQQYGSSSSNFGTPSILLMITCMCRAFDVTYNSLQLGFAYNELPVPRERDTTFCYLGIVHMCLVSSGLSRGVESPVEPWTSLQITPVDSGLNKKLQAIAQYSEIYFQIWLITVNVMLKLIIRTIQFSRKICDIFKLGLSASWCSPK